MKQTITANCLNSCAITHVYILGFSTRCSYYFKAPYKHWQHENQMMNHEWLIYNHESMQILWIYGINTHELIILVILIRKTLVPNICLWGILISELYNRFWISSSKNLLKIFFEATEQVLSCFENSMYLQTIWCNIPGCVECNEDSISWVWPYIKLKCHPKLQTENWIIKNCKVVYRLYTCIQFLTLQEMRW